MKQLDRVEKQMVHRLWEGTLKSNDVNGSLQQQLSESYCKIQ
jgi:hypothetical protein